jgi:mannose-6-phosphate isomerase-like protein (cupin superfamily)
MTTTPEINKFDSTLLINALTGDSFQASGRRSFLSYRDLGVAESTKGRVGAVISRSTDPDEIDVTTGWHYHVCDLQLIYIIRGWVDIEFEETGVIRLGAGTCINIPPGLLHNEIAIAPDNEILEVTIPPKIETITVTPPVKVGDSTT